MRSRDIHSYCFEELVKIRGCLSYFNHNWQQQAVPLRCGVMDTAQSLPGVMHPTAVTVRQFEISSTVCSRFKPLLMGPLLRFWQMDPSSPGVMHNMAGDSLGVQDQLRGVQQIQATESAFAAILADGSVVTWGDAYRGGDSLGVQDQLRGVQQIQAARDAFAAILADGSVVTWGDAFHGDKSAVRNQLKGVHQIQATRFAFAGNSCRWFRRYMGSCRLWQ